MQKLVIAALGAAALGALTFAGKKIREQRKTRRVKEDISRWEGEGGSPHPKPANPDLNPDRKGQTHGEAILDR